MHRARGVMNKLLTSDQATYAPKVRGLLTASRALYFRMAPTKRRRNGQARDQRRGIGPRHGIANERGDDHQKRDYRAQRS